MDPGAYLERIGLDPRADLGAGGELLRRLHLAHLRTVPFESLDIQLARPIRLDPAALFAKVVGRRRGGFCYELNGLFAELLGALGFAVQHLSARVHGADGLGPEHDHMLLLVELGGERRLCDVGFGDAFLEPLPLVEGPAPDGRHALRRTAGSREWELVDGAAGEPRYRFTTRSHALRDFEGMCAFHSTDPASHFARRTICSRATRSGRVTLVDRRRIVTAAGEREEHEVREASAYGEALRTDFGIELGADLGRLWEAAGRTGSSRAG